MVSIYTDWINSLAFGFLIFTYKDKHIFHTIMPLSQKSLKMICNMMKDKTFTRR